MPERVALTFLLYIFSTGICAQQGSENSLRIRCSESKLTPTGASFKLIISNNTADTFLIPQKILSGPINSGINLVYEVHYVDERGDTTDLLKNVYYDIHYATTLPWNEKNVYSLFPGRERLIEQYIYDNLLEKKGNYLIRFSIKKETLFHKGIHFGEDLKSDWIKIVQTKDKSRGRNQVFK